MFYGVPPMPAVFVGRDEVVRALAARLTAGGARALSAVGLPGVGKTTLAVAVAHDPEVLAHFGDGVLWAGLGPASDLAGDLSGWAAALGLDASAPASPEERAAAVQGRIGTRRMLLVIDDAWDADAARLLKCGGPNCCYLLTTGREDVARSFAGAADRVESIPVLTDAAALDLLRELAPEACDADPRSAEALVRAAGGLPLAVELLGGFLSAPERRYFADTATASMGDLLSDPRKRLRLAGSRLGADTSVEVTLQQAIELSLSGLPGPAVEAFYALGAFAAKPATFDRAAAEAVTGAGAGVLGELIARRLVDFHEGRLSIHQTVADVARTRTAGEAKARHRAHYLEIAWAAGEDWRRVESVYPQIRWGWSQLAPENGRERLNYVWAMGPYQNRRGLWKEYLAWSEAALGDSQRLEEPRSHAVFLNNLGYLHDVLGRRAEALGYYEQALPAQEEAGDRSKVADILNNLGSVYHSLGQQAKALEHYERVLPIREEVGDRAGLAITLNGIGLVYHSLGQRAKALEYYERALAIRDEVGDREGLAVTLTNLGRAHHDLGQCAKALEHYERALSILEDTGRRAGLAIALNNIGAVYQTLGQWAKALEYYGRARPIQEEVGDRAELATTLNNMGNVHSHLGSRPEALECMEQALLIGEEVGNRAGQASTLNNIGRVYYGLGQWAKALEYYGRARPLQEEVGDRAGLAATLDNIGGVYSRQGERAKALEYYEQALPIREEVGDRAGLAVTLNNLGAVYGGLGEPAKALGFYERALPILEEVGDRATLAATLGNLGFVYDGLGDPAKALQYYRQALAMHEEVGDREGEVVTRYNLAMLHRAAGRLPEAAAELRRVVELDEAIQHPDLEQDREMLRRVEAELAERGSE